MDALQPSAAEVRWSSATYAAVRWPRRWFTLRRFVWLVFIGFCGFVILGMLAAIWVRGCAADGEGIPGLWTAQQQNSGNWSGESSRRRGR